MDPNVDNSLFLYLLNRAVAVVECNWDKIKKVSCVPEPALNWNVNQGCLRIWGKGSPGKQLGMEKTLMCLRNRKETSMSDAESQRWGRKMNVENDTQVRLYMAMVNSLGSTQGILSNSGDMKEFSVLKDHSGCFVENVSWAYRCN